LARNESKEKNATSQFLINPKETDYVLGFEAASMSNQIPMFRGNVVSSSSRTYQSFNVRTLRSLKRPVFDHPPTPPHVTEERDPQPQLCESQKTQNPEDF
jgi:hypothetical protein